MPQIKVTKKAIKTLEANIYGYAPASLGPDATTEELAEQALNEAAKHLEITHEHGLLETLGKGIGVTLLVGLAGLVLAGIVAGTVALVRVIF